MPKTRRENTAGRTPEIRTGQAPALRTGQAPALRSPDQNRAVMIWLFVFALSVACLVIWGGFTRLTRSGLSIVEWNPVSGIFPPVGAQAWQEEFAKYRETPEFQQVNSGMTLEQYRYIFYIEWIHRMLARAIGLLYALPFFYFLFTKKIRRRDSGPYIVIGLLFIFQAFAGWFMVASGLEERPSVSHYLLTFHLLLALALFGLSLRQAFGHLDGFPAEGKAPYSLPSRLAAAALIVLVIQILYGGLTAGLKAGHISDTWPRMSGQVIPQGLFHRTQPWIPDLVESPLTVAFIHRWFALTVLGVAVAVYLTARRLRVPHEALIPALRQAQASARLMGALVTVQILLGIAVVIFHVRIELALLHQTVALGLLASNLLLLHKLRVVDHSLTTSIHR